MLFPLLGNALQSAATPAVTICFGNDDEQSSNQFRFAYLLALTGATEQLTLSISRSGPSELRLIRGRRCAAVNGFENLCGVWYLYTMR